jgi:phospholipid/cholesterol/gamma-HCH transport system substrate-binding protein
VPIKTIGLAALLLMALVFGLIYGRFENYFTPKITLTMIAGRGGLVMDPGSKVTLNGVPIGRVDSIQHYDDGGDAKAKILLDVNPRYVSQIPANVRADIKATTVFGNKYVALSWPEHPVAARIESGDVIDATSVTTEFNTLFETVTEIGEKIDPIELNKTLSATSQAFEGLGTQFGESLLAGERILDQVNPRMPTLTADIRRLADLAEVYEQASPDLWRFLDNGVVTAETLNEHSADLDRVLEAGLSFAETGAYVFEKGEPYFVRSVSDLTATSGVLDTYSPEFFCGIRNYDEIAPMVSHALGANGYSLQLASGLLGAENPYVYPDNLPRVNAKGGPGGKPGCWQKITRELWPAPVLVMDTGATIAPYDHFESATPMFTEYVWGRQVGENTINP